jgi:hypothetical protein
VIRFRCPSCGEEQSIPIVGEFRVGKKVTCLKCSVPLTVLVLALTQEQVLRTLTRREIQK